jgi:hypothetical protein
MRVAAPHAEAALTQRRSYPWIVRSNGWSTTGRTTAWTPDCGPALITFCCSLPPFFAPARRPREDIWDRLEESPVQRDLRSRPRRESV